MAKTISYRARGVLARENLFIGVKDAAFHDVQYGFVLAGKGGFGVLAHGAAPDSDTNAALRPFLNITVGLNDCPGNVRGDSRIDDRGADFGGSFVLLGHFVGEERFLDANGAARSVTGSVAIEQAVMIKLPVTAAIARLLRKHLGDLLGDHVRRHYNRPPGEPDGRQSGGQGLGFLGGFVIRRINRIE